MTVEVRIGVRVRNRGSGRGRWGGTFLVRARVGVRMGLLAGVGLGRGGTHRAWADGAARSAPDGRPD